MLHISIEFAVNFDVSQRVGAKHNFTQMGYFYNSLVKISNTQYYYQNVTVTYYNK